MRGLCFGRDVTLSDEQVVSTIHMTKGSQAPVRETKQVPLLLLLLPSELLDAVVDTPRYLVDTVCDRIRLNKEMVVP